MEILHDLNSQIRDMEDTMADNERLKEKTSSTWARNVSNFYNNITFLIIKLKFFLKRFIGFSNIYA